MVYSAINLSILMALVRYVTSQNKGLREYCAHEAFNATCPESQVIIIEHALYGRMRFGRCMKEDHGHVGCSANVLPDLDRQCSGKRQCSVAIPLPKVQDLQCPAELLQYLEVDYRCQPVEPATTCLRHRKTSSLKAENISNFLMPPTDLRNSKGTKRCPWIITTDPGQQINLTILNFNVPKETLFMNEPLECNMIAIITENGKNIEKPICRDNRREMLFYVSSSHYLEMYIVSRSKVEDPPRFLIAYRAIGCPNIPPASMPNAWIGRKDDTLTVKCNYTGETFFLSCTGTQWVGELHNCTIGANYRNGSNHEKSKFPYGLLIVIGIGVALGVALGIILLAGILTCFKRRKQQDKAMSMSHHTSDPLLSEVTRESEADNTSNYYERRCQTLATIGRSPRIPRESIYSERCLVTSQHSHPGVRTLPANYGRATGPPLHNSQIVQNSTGESPYCSCVHPVLPQQQQQHQPPNAPPPPSSQPAGNSSSNAQTSFITFKPSGSSPEDCPTIGSDSRQITAARSLDLLKDYDHTKIHERDTHSMKDVNCTCNNNLSEHLPNNCNNSILHQENPFICDTSNNKSI